MCDLQMKDVILSVNRKDVATMTQPQVQHIIDMAARQGHVELKIKREMGEGKRRVRLVLLFNVVNNVSIVPYTIGRYQVCVLYSECCLLYLTQRVDIKSVCCIVNVVSIVPYTMGKYQVWM